MFRFTIRDVLWLTVVVAMAVALWVNHRQHRSEIEARAEEARRSFKTTLTRVRLLELPAISRHLLASQRVLKLRLVD